VEGSQTAALSRQVRDVFDGINNYVVDDGSQPFSLAMEPDSRGAAMRKLEEGRTRAVIIMTQKDDSLEGIEAVIEVTETVVSDEYMLELPRVLGQYSTEISASRLQDFLDAQAKLYGVEPSGRARDIAAPLEVNYQTNEWKELRYFDFYASAIMIILAMLLPLSLSLIAITSERTRGTLERVFVSPFRQSEIISGKMLAYSAFAVLFVLLVIGTLKAVFNITVGNVGLVVLIATLVGVNGVILGLIISAVTRNEAESVTVGIMAVFAIMGLMTYIVPWETMHPIARTVSHFIPYTYGIQASRLVNMVGLGFSDVWTYLLILAGFIVVQTLLAFPLLRRKIT
jgi:ABC-type Na+ efflux pump permease subunit